MATGIYPLQNGKYRWHVMVEGKRFHGLADSAKEAQQQRAKALTESSQGLAATPGNVTFADHLSVWLSEKERSRAVRTSLGYKYTSETYISDTFKRRKLKDLRAVHIRQLYTELQERGVNGKHTLRLVHCLLHGVLESAVRDELIARNPAKSMKPDTTSKDDVKDLQVFTPTEANAFAQTCKSHRWGSIFLFLLLTGLRRGEACGLIWANVDLDSKTPYIRVEQALHTAGKERLLTRPKTKSSRRVIYLSADAVEVLQHTKQEQAELRERLGTKAKHNDFVFTNSLGDMLAPNNLKTHMNAICKQAGLKRIRIHDLRHTYASLALRAGSRIEVVSKQLGHSSATMTLDVYRHVYQEEMQTALPASVLFGQTG